VLTAFRPDDHPWQYGVFTGHAQVNGIDFWHEKGWIRSRGLVSVVEKSDRVEIVSRSDWLTQRRGGERLLVEEQVITVHAPERPDRYAVDFEWRLTPDVEVTFGRYDYGGLAFRPANHSERRHEGAASPNPAEAMGRPWLDMSGRFGEGASGAVCGAAIFDHPANPSFPGGWRADGQGLINPAISLKGPLALPAGKTATFRYRLLVHAGHGEREMLEAEYRRWASDRASPGGSRSEPPRER
jgi:hypothetical protein